MEEQFTRLTYRDQIMSGLRENPRINTEPSTGHGASLWEWVLVGVLTITGALLRLPFITQVPPGLQGDEAWMGLEAQRILRQGWIGIWSPEGWGQPAGTFYWSAFLFSFLPNTTTVLRSAMALLGIATIPVLYLFVRNLFGQRPAAIATVLLTFSYWHIHYSRTAFSLISAPLVECAVLLFLGKGIKERRSWPFLTAGTIAGLGIYTYRGYVYFALLLVALWGVILVFRPYPLRRLARHFFLFAIPALILVMPMFTFVVERYNDYMGYGRITSVFRTQEYAAAVQNGERLGFLGGKVARATSIYYVGRNGDSTDGLGAKSLLDPVTAPLFTLGLGIGVWHWRRWQYLLILGGVIIGIAAVATTVTWGENRRGIAALPMVFAASGIGGHLLLCYFERLCRRLVLPWGVYLRLGLLYPCLVVAIIFVAVWNTQGYFKEIGPGESARFAYAYELSLASNYLRSLQNENPYVYFYVPRWPWEYEARRFQAPGLIGENRSEEHGKFTLEKQADLQRVVFLVMPPYDQYLQEIQRRYPGGQYHEVKEDNRILFAAYYLQGK